MSSFTKVLHVKGGMKEASRINLSPVQTRPARAIAHPPAKVLDIPWPSDGRYRGLVHNITRLSELAASDWLGENGGSGSPGAMGWDVDGRGLRSSHAT